MLKVIFTIDCDFCREPMETAAVCCDFETLVWESFAWDLRIYAETQGWDYDEKRNRFLCSQCAEQIEEVKAGFPSDG